MARRAYPNAVPPRKIIIAKIEGGGMLNPLQLLIGNSLHCKKAHELKIKMNVGGL